MNAPNLITLTRLLITAICFALLGLEDPLNPEPTPIWWAFWLFVIAAATDFLDGYLARKTGTVTAFGRVVDPLADKILVCGILVMLLDFPAARISLMSTWYVVVILAREFLVTTIRGLAESQGVQFPAERLGKYKMVVQCFAAGGLLTLVAGSTTFEFVAVWGLWITLVLTVVSGAQYVYRARRLLFA